MDDKAKNPKENLTTKQVSTEFNIKEGTLRGWRRLRQADKRYPRFHVRYPHTVYYVREEFEQDLAAMEVTVEDKEI